MNIELSSSSGILLGAFPKSCAPYLPPIASYCLTDTDPPDPPPPINEPPYLPIPITPPIDMGCFPISLVTSLSHAYDRSVGSLSASIGYQGGDPCFPILNIDLDIPCTLTAAQASGAVNQLGETAALSVYTTTGTNCDLSLGFSLWIPPIDIDLACPQLEATASLSRVAFTGFAGQSYWLNAETTARFGQGAEVMGSSSSGIPGPMTCVLLLDLNLGLPCPVSLSANPSLSHSWARAPVFTITQDKAALCTPSLNMDLWLPCPTSLSVSLSTSWMSLQTARSTAPTATASFKAIGGQECNLELDLDLVFPHACPASFIKNGTATDAWTQRSGSFWISLSRVSPNATTCDFNINYDLKFPCALSTDFGKVTINKDAALDALRFNSLTAGELWVRTNRAEIKSDCTFEMDLGVQMPCTNMQIPTLAAGSTGFAAWTPGGTRLGNFLLSLTQSTLSGAACINSLAGSLVMEGGGGGESGRFAKIIDVAMEVDPFLYGGQEVLGSISGNFLTWRAIDTFLPYMFNLAETTDQGDASVPIGTIVRFWPGAGDAQKSLYAFHHMNYRGTYG